MLFPDLAAFRRAMTRAVVRFAQVVKESTDSRQFPRTGAMSGFEFRMEGIALAGDFPYLAAFHPVACIVARQVADKGPGADHDQGRFHVVGGGGRLEFADE